MAKKRHRQSICVVAANEPDCKVHAIVEKLTALRAEDSEFTLFGANEHRYVLNQTLSRREAEGIESRYRFKLPEEYRWFITTVGNGGAGPYYGLFPVGMHDDGHDLGPWESGGLVGEVGRPFLHAGPWNLSEDFWSSRPNSEEAASEQEEDALWENWDNRLEAEYWAPQIMQGAIPICHEGCALREWLVVTGSLAGTVWRDLRADNAGIVPLVGDDGKVLSFLAWYESWLDSSLRQSRMNNAQLPR